MSSLKLPFDLYGHILDYISDSRDLYALLFTSRAFHEEASRRIHRSLHEHDTTEEVLSHLTSHPQLLSYVRHLSIYVNYGESALRKELIKRLLQEVENLESLTLRMGDATDPNELLHGSQLRLTSFRCSHPLNPSVLEHPPILFDRLRVLSLSFSLDPDATAAILAPLNALLRAASQLEHLKLKVIHWVYHTLREGTPQLSILLDGCTFHLHTLSCAGLLPDHNIIPFLQTQSATLRKLCLQTTPEDWPDLSKTISGLFRLKVLKIFRSPHNDHLPLSIAPLLGTKQLFHSIFTPYFSIERSTALDEFMAGQTAIRSFNGGPLPSEAKQLRTAEVSCHHLRDVLALGPKLERLVVNMEPIPWDEDLRQMIVNQLDGLRALKLKIFVWDTLSREQVLFLLSNTPELRYLHLYQSGAEFKITELIESPNILFQLRFLHVDSATPQEVSQLFATRPRLRLICIGRMIGQITGGHSFLVYSRFRIEGVEISRNHLPKDAKRLFKDKRWVQ